MNARVQIINVSGTGPWTVSLGFYYPSSGYYAQLSVGDQFVGNSFNNVFEITNKGTDAGGGIVENIVIIDVDSSGNPPISATIGPLWTPTGKVKLFDGPLADIGASQIHSIRNRDNVLSGDIDMSTDIYDNPIDSIVDSAAKIDGIDSAGNLKYYGTNISGAGGFNQLGTMALQDSGSVSITGGTIIGTNVNTDITVISGQVSALETGYNRRAAVIDIVNNTVAPPSENDGDRYILDFTGASHANWDGAAPGSIVQYDATGGTWAATTPVEGYVAYVDVQDQDALYVDDGTPVWELRSVGVVNHNDLSAIQGGITTERYHLTNTQHIRATTAFTGDSGSGGTVGLVPGPSAGDATRFLRGDGTWQVTPDTAPGGTNNQIQINNSGSFGGISVDGSTITISGGTLFVPDNGVTVQKLETDAKTALMEEIISGPFGDVATADIYADERGISWIYNGPTLIVTAVYLVVGLDDSTATTQPTVQINIGGQPLLSSAWTISETRANPTLSANTTIADGNAINIAIGAGTGAAGDAENLSIYIRATVQ